jgi:hypothetical protein
MSLAHLKVPKVPRKSHASLAAGDAPAVRPGPIAECGASHEPLYRTLDEAHESGLEVCGTCVALARRHGRGAR